MEKIIKTYHDMGIEVIISGEKFSDMACHFINKYNMFAFRNISKFRIRRICRLTGARPCVTLEIRKEDVGFISKAYTREVGLKTITVLEQNKNTDASVSTIVLRGATDNAMNDMERAVNDGVNVVKSITRDCRFVPGAGAAELELARLMGEFAGTHTGLEQYGVRKYGEALEVVP